MLKSRRTPELFVGITSWNSALFLGRCIHSVRNTTAADGVRVVVVDNGSEDDSRRLASQAGAEVIVRKCRQGDALNDLLAVSKSPYTLLLHADVILLSGRWFEIVRSKLDEHCVLAAPEDIGCGPYTRPFGVGKPESSFLFMATDSFKRIRSWRRGVGSLFARLPHKTVDFFGHHVTHNLPGCLAEKGLTWYAMNVHASSIQNEPIYEPNFKPGVWREDLGFLRYGLGNFYSVDGIVTHYHNWYDRVYQDVPMDSTRTTAQNGEGFPLAFVKAYTDSFIKDYDAGEVQLPTTDRTPSQPQAL